MSEHKKALQIPKPLESKMKKAGKRIGDALRKFKEPMDEEKLIIPQMGRRQFLKIGALTAAGAILSTSKLGKFVGLELGKAFAQETISLAEIEKLDKETEEKGWRGTTNVMQNSFYQVLDIPVLGKNWILASTLLIEWGGNENRNDIIVTIVNNQGQRVGAQIRLDSLSEAYKKFSGQEMKYVKLVGEQGHSKKFGPYVNIFVIPVAEPNGAIKLNTPIIQISYVAERIYSGTGEPILISSR